LSSKRSAGLAVADFAMSGSSGPQETNTRDAIESAASKTVLNFIVHPPGGRAVRDPH